MNKLIQQGWECPKCGGVYSPLTSKCNVCPQGTTLSTTTTNTSITTDCVNYIHWGDGKCINCGKQQYLHINLK